MHGDLAIEDLARRIQAGERRSLARALTLVESQNAQHEQDSLRLFQSLKSVSASFRLGVTGPPGAGKSTLIEQLVLGWVEAGHRVAVLAVDPSSRKTGGSLLGDKTRMGEIAHLPQVFVRPSPSREHLGGLGRRTPLMCSLLERAGYSRIVVETVGVGQSEIGARYLVDQLLLVALPGAGDEVQGIKRGLMEEIDLVAVNKADLGASKATAAVLRSAFRVFKRSVPVLEISALQGDGVESLLAELEKRADSLLAMSGPAVTFTEREVHIFEQYSMECLTKVLRGSGGWLELKAELDSGRSDFLQVLPRLRSLFVELEQRVQSFDVRSD